MTTDTVTVDGATTPAAEQQDPELNDQAVEAFAEKVFLDVAGAHTVFMGAIGDRLGLFRDLAENGPATSDELAARTHLAERYVREWALGMTAAGYLERDPLTGTFSMPAHHVPVLVEEAGLAFAGNAFFDYSTIFGEGFAALLGAFRTGEGLSQDAFPEAQESIDRFTAPWFVHSLVPRWLPLLPDVEAALRAGGTLCDVGCGQGHALVRLAEAFPEASFVGYDVFAPAVEAARRRAADAGVADRVRFEVADATQGVPGRFDVVTVFDVLHDSRDPRAILRSIHDALAPGGTFIAVDIAVPDDVAENVGPGATLVYGLSLKYCLPVSLHDGGAGLGTAGLPQALLTELATAAGFTGVRRMDIDDPLNTLYVLTP
jgi:SAM-dependent methyltransferase